MRKETRRVFKDKFDEARKLPKSQREKEISRLMEWCETYEIAQDFQYDRCVLEKIAGARNYIQAANILLDAHRKEIA